LCGRMGRRNRIRTSRRIMHIYYHADLDGVTSSVVLADYLLAQGTEVASYTPVDHDRLHSWRTEKLSSPSAVLDFEFHPDADYWFDHHSNTKESAIANGLTRVHDVSYQSCTSLVSDHLKKRFGYYRPEFDEMVRHSDQIDAGDFLTPNAWLSRNPWIELALFISLQGTPVVLTQVIRSLIENKGCPEGLFEDRFSREMEGCRLAQEQTRSQIARESRLIQNGSIVVHPPIHYAFHKFLPFCVFSEVSLSIGPVEKDGFYRVVLCKNWYRGAPSEAFLESTHIGELCRSLGGGGHRDRGGFPCDDLADCERKIHQVLGLMVPCYKESP
jgi:hypothetical protein